MSYIYIYIAILCEPLSLLLFVKSPNLFLYFTGQPHNFPIDPSIYGECSYESSIATSIYRECSYIDTSICGECSCDVPIDWYLHYWWGMFLGFSHWYLHLWEIFPCFSQLIAPFRRGMLPPKSRPAARPSPDSPAAPPDLLRMGIPQRKFLAELQRCRTFGYG